MPCNQIGLAYTARTRGDWQMEPGRGEGRGGGIRQGGTYRVRWEWEGDRGKRREDLWFCEGQLAGESVT